MRRIQISTTKVAEIRALAQVNPEIGSNDSGFLDDLVESAALWLTRECGLSQYPELLAGYSQSGASPSTDVTAAASNHFYLSVNGSPMQDIEPVLASCGTGANTATELQRVIRAVEDEQWGFSEVTVAYASSLYTIASGKYGERSQIAVAYDQETSDLCRLLKLSPDYGGVQARGSVANPEYDQCLSQMVQVAYRKVGFEGLSEGAAADGISFKLWDVDPYIKRFIQTHRRLFR